MSLYSPFGLPLGAYISGLGCFRMAVVGVAKDVYLEKFGLDPKSFSVMAPWPNPPMACLLSQLSPSPYMKLVDAVGT